MSWRKSITSDNSDPAVGSWRDSITEEPQPEKSLMDVEIPLTPFFDPTVRDVVDTGKSVGTPILEGAKDFSIGAAQGATLGAADEIGGGLAAILEKAASYIPGTAANNTKNVNEQLGLPQESLTDAYRSYQQGSEDEFIAAGKRSPWLNTAGNIGGSIATGTAIGGALGVGARAKDAKSVFDIAKESGKGKALVEALKRGGVDYAKATPLIAAESALTSEGNFGENKEQLVKDVLGGLAFGLPTVLGLNAVTDVAAPAAKEAINNTSKKLDQFVETRPFLRQLKKSFQYGEEGINPVSENQQVRTGLNEEGLIGRHQTQTKQILDEVMAADSKLGKAVGKSLEDATKAGKTVNIDEPVARSLKALDFSYQTFQDIGDNSRGKQIFDRIARKTGGSVTPSEAKDLLDDVDSFIGKFKASGNRTTTEEAILGGLQKVRKELSDQLKSQIPEYASAAGQFAKFRELVPEQILAKNLDPDTAGVFMGNLRNADKPLMQNLQEITEQATRGGSSSDKTKLAYEKLIRGMRQVEAGGNSPLARSADDYQKAIRDLSDDAAARRQMTTVEESRGIGKNAVAWATGAGEAPRSMALGSANLAGRMSKPLAETSRRIYNWGPDKLNTLADQMSAKPALAHLGKALKQGLANGDQAKKNAALFSILQNPDARIEIGDED